MSRVVWKSDNLEKLILTHSEISLGCFVDTNILISANLSIDRSNEEVEGLIEKFARLKIPLYCNVNVRSEFLEIYRRILIPECLIEFLEDAEDEIEEVLVFKLRSVKTSYRKSLDSGKVYKFNDDRIKEFRDLFESRTSNGKTGWQIFCEHYLLPKLTPVWEEVVDQCGLNFIRIREHENNPLMEEAVNWERAVELIGRFGISSADAMIINLFFSSKLKVLFTADKDFFSLSSEIAARNKIVLSL